MAKKTPASETPENETPKSGFRKRKILLIVLVLLLLGGGAFAGYMLFMAPPGTSMLSFIGGSNDGSAPTAESPRSGEYENIKIEKGQTISMTPFLVNLADPLGRRYIKMSMDVELRTSGDVKAFQDSMPRARDSILILLSSKTMDDVSSVEGKILLKNEIINRINQILGGPKVIQVYFTDMVIQ